MDHTHSETLPSNAFADSMLAVINALKLVKDDPDLRNAVETLARNPRLQEAARGLSRMFRPDEASPNKDIHKEIDNTPKEPIETVTVVHNILDPKVQKVEAVVEPMQVLPRRPILSLLVPPTPIKGRNKSALVIEHDKSLSRMFKKLLEGEDYVVRTARDGEDAVDLYRNCAPFEVVLVQYLMPRKHGIDVALEILEQDPTQPMMIITSDFESEHDVPRRKEFMHRLAEHRPELVSRFIFTTGDTANEETLATQFGRSCCKRSLIPICLRQLGIQMGRH